MTYYIILRRRKIIFIICTKILVLDHLMNIFREGHINVVWRFVEHMDVFRSLLLIYTTLLLRPDSSGKGLERVCWRF